MKHAPSILTAFLLGLVGLARGDTELNRDRDPVVIPRSALGPLLGRSPAEIVAFRYDGGWHQIPVQIDERKVVDFGVVYNEAPKGILTLAYADASTYTGPDTDPTFDADDELVFMARDAGGVATVGAGWPPRTLAAPALRVIVLDPRGSQGDVVYLFVSDGTLSPDAGQDRVAYSFNLLSGPYIPTYRTLSGPNPESSQAVTAYYREHFSDRWIRDETNVYAGGAAGSDILDRHKNMFAPGNCVRTENTFSNGEGAFFANKDGPLRAIRSYLGANSGPLTQRDHFFYEQRHDVVTSLRVHAISGMLDVYDYSPAAAGMLYYNSRNAAGRVIDGVPDAITPGPIYWELVTGLQGTLAMAIRIETDIVPFNTTSYYSDDSTPSVTQCTGDAFEYGTSGVWINQSIPNTDPALGAYKTLTARRVIYYEPPGHEGFMAQEYLNAVSPLTASASLYTGVPADIDGDGDVDGVDYGSFAACFNGRGVPPCGGALLADLNGDAYVDGVDYGLFSACFNGSGNPPACS